MDSKTIQIENHSADKLERLVDFTFGMVKVATGFGFPEGPVMMPQGFLIFSDITNDQIVRFSRPDRTAIYRNQSKGANGNTLDLQGRLISCETGYRRLSRTETNGDVTVLADNYQGKLLNATNDVIVRNDGTILFTDPIFLGEYETFLGSSYKALDFSGVYSIDAKGNLSLVTTSLDFPNGLALSPDEKTLLVGNSDDNCIYAFGKNSDGYSSKGDLWLEMDSDLTGVADGLKVDIEGNVYSTGPGGIWVADHSGKPLGIIKFEEITTNLAFYGLDSHMLVVTAPPSLYMLKLKVPGISVLERL